MDERSNDRDRAKAAKEKEAKETVKITNQFHSKGGMAYDLKCDGARLTLFVQGRSTEDDSGEWRVEARGSRSPEAAVVVAEWGSTKIEALRAVGKSWASKAPSLGLATFDWEAIAQALVAVRAM